MVVSAVRALWFFRGNLSPVLSEVLPVGVRVAVSATYTRSTACSLRAGVILPGQAGTPRRGSVPPGRRLPTVARGRTDANGRYSIAWVAGCGSHDLVVAGFRSESNLAGRTLYDREDVTAAR